MLTTKVVKFKGNLCFKKSFIAVSVSIFSSEPANYISNRLVVTKVMLASGGWGSIPWLSPHGGSIMAYVVEKSLEIGGLLVPI